MTTVPSNLIPTRITQLPEYQGVSTLGFLPYVIDGVTYKVQFSNIAAVGAVPSTRTITGGGGLTGGGDLSADRVISIAAGGVGFGQLADSGVAAGAYGDATNIPVLTVDTKGRVTVAATTPIDLTAYVPTSRAILTGDGLTGGGTLAVDRTISLTLSTALPESGGTPSAGTATVAAREDHVHPAVDLSDATETSGALPMSRGGTGSSLSPAAGAILYSDGSSVNLSGAGTANQLFFSQGGAAPIFRSLTGGTTGLVFGLSGSAYALSGTLATANGGTGQTTYADGQLLIGKTDGTLAKATLTAGTGVSVANGDGTITVTNTAPDQVVSLTAGANITVTGSYPSFTIAAAGGSGTVTSVDLTAGTGISVAGGPITTSGSITVTNTAPDQTVVLTAGTNVSITGTYPSFTINSTDQFAGTVTSVDVSGGTTGLSFTGGPVTTSGTITMAGTLAVANGGTGQTTFTDGQLLIGKTDGTLAKATLTAGTGVSVTNADGAITVTNTAPDQTVVLTAGTNVSITGTYPAFTINSTDQFVGTVTSVGGTGTVNGLTLTGTVTSSGNLTLGGTLTGVDLTTAVTGTLPVANGGTGQTTFTNGQLLIGNTTGNTLTKATLTAGTNISITNGAGAITINSTDQFVGTVTSVSVVSANGLAGTVATDTTTPAITLSTSVTGVVKGNGTALSAAVAGTDYVAPGAITTSGLTMATARLLGRTTAGTGAAEEITVGSGLTLSAGTLTATGGGTVTSVDVSGGTTGLTFSGGPVTTSGTITMAGTLAVGNGGTGATTLTGVVIGNGTSAFTTVTAPSGAIVGTTDTQTLTNKRIDPRVVAASGTSGNLTINGDTTDVYKAEGLTGAITFLQPSGTPVDGQKLMIRLEDDGTARGITWTTSAGAFREVGITLPTTTVATKITYVGCVYNGTDSFWDAIATVTQA
jgi:hypothetical protein